MALQALVLPLVSVFRSAGFNEAFKAIKNLDGGFKEVAKSAGLAAASFAAAGVLQSVTQYIDEAVVVTQKFERNMLALNQVFESNFSTMQRFTKDAQDMGISQGQAAQAAVFLGSVLKQYGLEAGATAGETQKLIGLSQDLATTYGYDLQEALLAMTALFRGEYDPIEKFGVAMKQSEINALLASRGQNKLTGELLMQAQVQARLDLLYQRSADAMGAFDRASGTLYVSQQKLNAAIENQQIAFGEPLQKPLAIVTDLFAKLTVMTTPLVASLGAASGAIIELLGSALAKIAEGANAIVYEVDRAKNAIYGLIGAANDATGGDAPKMDKRAKDIYALEQRVYGLKVALEQAGKAQTGLNANENISNLTNQLKDAEQELSVVKYATYDATTELKRFKLMTDSTRVVLNGSLPVLTGYALALQTLGIYSVDAEGKLTGLAGIFDEIETKAAKSKATEQLKAMGFAASQIEYYLTKPDWAKIFGEITKLAFIANTEIAKIPSVTAAAGFFNMQADSKAAFQKLLSESFDTKSTTATAKKVAKDFVKAFTNGLKESQQQASAAAQLGAMGASQGLIDSILSAENWMKVWLAIKNGTLSLKALQQQFYQTAAGADELLQKTEEIAAAAASVGSVLDRLVPAKELGEFQDETLGIFADFRDELKALVDAQLISKSNYENLLGWSDAFQAKLMEIAKQRDEVVKQIEETEERLKDVKAFQFSDKDIQSFIQPFKYVDDSISQYEQNVTGFIDSITEKLRDGLEQKIFTPEAAANLRQIVIATEEALTAIVRKQESVAKELERFQNAFDFREATKQALVSYADVTNILSKATDKLNSATKSATASTTEIIAQTIKSARNARDYRVILIKELDSIEQATASAGDITAGLEDVLKQTRDFASNLKTLQTMGLNTEVFQQIVEAGTEVGNQTAKAIIAGGPEAVMAINDLYEEIGLASTDASAIAADKVYDLNGQIIESGIQAFKDESVKLADEASKTASNAVMAFQKKIDDYIVDLSGLLTALTNKKTAFETAAATLGKAFADTLKGYIDNALAGMTVPVVTEEAVKDVIDKSGLGDGGGGAGGGGAGNGDGNGDKPEIKPKEPPLTEEFKLIGGQVHSAISGATGILIDSASDIGKAIGYLDERIGAALEYMDQVGISTPEGQRANALAAEFWQSRDMLVAKGFNGQPYVININVKTDTTQSTAMVGRTLGNVLNKYITAGGGLVVSSV